MFSSENTLNFGKKDCIIVRCQKRLIMTPMCINKHYTSRTTREEGKIDGV
jgi:hypothetical protein